MILMGPFQCEIFYDSMHKYKLTQILMLFHDCSSHSARWILVILINWPESFRITTGITLWEQDMSFHYLYPSQIIMFGHTDSFQTLGK